MVKRALVILVFLGSTALCAMSEPSTYVTLGYQINFDQNTGYHRDTGDRLLYGLGCDFIQLGRYLQVGAEGQYGHSDSMLTGTTFNLFGNITYWPVDRNPVRPYFAGGAGLMHQSASFVYKDIGFDYADDVLGVHAKGGVLLGGEALGALVELQLAHAFAGGEENAFTQLQTKNVVALCFGVRVRMAEEGGTE